MFWKFLYQPYNLDVTSEALMVAYSLKIVGHKDAAVKEKEPIPKYEYFSAG